MASWRQGPFPDGSQGIGGRLDRLFNPTLQVDDLGTLFDGIVTAIHFG
jgi:hypothetical protein